MRRLFFVIFAAALFFIVQKSFVSAESGCGGTEFCQSTKIVNDYECQTDYESQSCTKVGVGTRTIDCTVTEDECYGYDRDTRCVYASDWGVCDETLGSRKKVSCCSGAGGGNYECSGETELVKECVSSCRNENRGARCDDGTGGPSGRKWWCFTLQCLTCSASTTAPTNLTVSQGAQITTAVASWTPGTGGTEHHLYAGTDKGKVEAGCPDGVGAGKGCVYSSDNATSPTEITGLGLGTVYYYRVVNYKDAACSSASPTVPDLTSCILSPSSRTLHPGESQVFTAGVNQSSEIQRVDFSAPPGNVSLSPGSDPLHPYQTEATALNPVDTDIILTGDVYFTGNPTPVCTSTAQINVTPPGPWWRVIDADVTTNGNLRSDVPDGEYFGLPGLGGYPGIPSYGGSSNLGFSNTSALGWLANSSYQSKKIYDYRFFKNQIPTDIQAATTIIPITSVSGSFFESGGTLAKGYYWYKYDGSQTGLDLTISSGMDIGDRKVVLLVDSADLYINGSINLTDGQGFFGVFVGTGTTGGGNIIINPSVGGSPNFDLEGIYFADDSFQTGISSAQLRVRGSVAAYGGVNLQRDLGGEVNPVTPSEVFEYGPDQIVLFPPKLSTYKMKWKEVAP